MGFRSFFGTLPVLQNSITEKDSHGRAPGSVALSKAILACALLFDNSLGAVILWGGEGDVQPWKGDFGARGAFLELFLKILPPQAPRGFQF